MKKFISKVMYLYDYLYYRIATSWMYGRLYKKYKRSSYASSIVSVFQFFIFFDIFMHIILCSFTISERKPYNQAFALFLCILIAIHGFINDKRYNSNYEEYEKRWGNLDKRTKDKLDVIVFLMAVIPLIYLPIITNVFDFTK